MGAGGLSFRAVKTFFLLVGGASTGQRELRNMSLLLQGPLDNVHEVTVAQEAEQTRQVVEW